MSIIRAGKIVESGTLGELRHLTRTSVRVELDSTPPDFTAVPGVHDLVVDGVRLRCQVDTAQLGDLLGRLISIGVRSLTTQPPTLEELFLRHYADEIPAGSGQADR